MVCSALWANMLHVTFRPFGNGRVRRSWQPLSLQLASLFIMSIKAQKCEHLKSSAPAGQMHKEHSEAKWVVKAHTHPYLVVLPPFYPLGSFFSGSPRKLLKPELTGSSC